MDSNSVTLFTGDSNHLLSGCNLLQLFLFESELIQARYKLGVSLTQYYEQSLAKGERCMQSLPSVNTIDFCFELKPCKLHCN